MLDHQTVIAELLSTAVYPAAAPFHPGEAYPEYGFEGVSSDPNPSYQGVRNCFARADLDSERFGTAEWNPLGELISPGEAVLLKPNLVKERHPGDPEGWRYVLTHGSVIRAVADYVWKAVGSTGKVIIADAPQTDSSFREIVEVLGLGVIRDFYRTHGLDLELIDLRQEEWVSKKGVVVERRELAGDPRGGVAFDLGGHSEFTGHRGGGSYYGADYDVATVNDHHTGGRHEYMIAGTAMKCDVIFSLPKLKTHKKAGITVSLKNLVGVNGDKNWLPHHTEGSTEAGGDEHPQPDVKHKVERRAVTYVRKLSAIPIIGAWLHQQTRMIGRRIFGDTEEVIRSGNWWGNDTIWRMCLDLNKLVLYGNADGTLREAVPGNRKRHFVLVDAILAGEGSGPISPDPVKAGIVIFGLHPATVDAACAYLMGFDPGRVPIVRQAFRCRHYPLAEWDWGDVRLVSNRSEWNGPLADIPCDSTLRFVPHFGWTGRIERRPLPVDQQK